MEENKEVKTATEQAKDSKKKDTKKDSKKKGSFLAEHKAEFKKITWPTRKEVAKETVTVIVISLLVGAIIFGMDTLLKMGYNGLTSLSDPADTVVDTTDLENQIDINAEGIDADVEFVTEAENAEAVTEAEVVVTTQIAE